MKQIWNLKKLSVNVLRRGRHGSPYSVSALATITGGKETGRDVELNMSTDEARAYAATIIAAADRADELTRKTQSPVKTLRDQLEKAVFEPENMDLDFLADRMYSRGIREINADTDTVMLRRYCEGAALVKARGSAWEPYAS